MTVVASNAHKEGSRLHRMNVFFLEFGYHTYTLVCFTWKVLISVDRLPIPLHPSLSLSPSILFMHNYTHPCRDTCVSRHRISLPDRETDRQTDRLSRPRDIALRASPTLRFTYVRRGNAWVTQCVTVGWYEGLGIYSSIKRKANQIVLLGTAEANDDDDDAIVLEWINYRERVHQGNIQGM